MNPYSGMHRVFLIILGINVMRVDAAENLPSLYWLMDGKGDVPGIYKIRGYIATCIGRFVYLQHISILLYLI